ncbi:MAG: acyl-CoA thioesterase [Desulfobacterales bacterium]|nr:acyl-CoA thioesterase [Desulfobacterales bacterium]
MIKHPKLYHFKRAAGDPPPLEAETTRTVRFEEVDALRVVWHGRYPSYFEDGRAAFGKRYNLGYLDMYNEGFLAPLVKLHFDFYAPLTFPEPFKIKARAIWSEASRMNFEYEIHNFENRLIATGYTVQLITDLNFDLQLITPPFLEVFRNRWFSGELL